MFQAISAVRTVDVMQLQRVAASGIRSEVMEPAQYDGTLARDKPCHEESFVQPFASDSCLERLVPPYSGVYTVRRNDRALLAPGLWSVF